MLYYLPKYLKITSLTERVPKVFQKGPKRVPKGSQKGSKRVLKGFQKGPKRVPKGFQKGPKRVPKGSQKGPKRVPKGSQKGSLSNRPKKMAPRVGLFFPNPQGGIFKIFPARGGIPPYPLQFPIPGIYTPLKTDFIAI